MSKKMKGVALDSSFYGSFEARFKNQRLLEDYQEVKKETEAAKSKLEAMKQRKLILLAEVRFLRQRQKHLLEIKAENPSQGRKVFHQPILQTRHKSSKMEHNGSKKQMELQSKSPVLDLKMKEMSSRTNRSTLKTKHSYVDRKEKNNGNKTFLRNTNPGFDVNRKQRKFGAKEDTFKHPSEIVHWNQKESFSVGKEINSQKKNLGFDLNQMERSYAVREEAVQNRVPVFDLNLKLGDEDDLHEKTENFFNGKSEEQLNDLKVSICRNVENVPDQLKKRKISCQDPVALKVVLHMNIPDALAADRAEHHHYPVTEPTCPQQLPGSLDCGTYVCYAMEQLLKEGEVPKRLKMDDILKYKAYMVQNMVDMFDMERLDKVSKRSRFRLDGD